MCSVKIGAINGRLTVLITRTELFIPAVQWNHMNCLIHLDVSQIFKLFLFLIIYHNSLIACYRTSCRTDKMSYSTRLLSGRSSAPFTFSVHSDVSTASPENSISPKPISTSVIEISLYTGEGSFISLGHFGQFRCGWSHHNYVLGRPCRPFLYWIRLLLIHL